MFAKLIAVFCITLSSVAFAGIPESITDTSIPKEINNDVVWSSTKSGNKVTSVVDRNTGKSVELVYSNSGELTGFYVNGSLYKVRLSLKENGQGAIPIEIQGRDGKVKSLLIPESVLGSSASPSARVSVLQGMMRASPRSMSKLDGDGDGDFGSGSGCGDITQFVANCDTGGGGLGDFGGGSSGAICQANETLCRDRCASRYNSHMAVCVAGGAAIALVGTPLAGLIYAAACSISASDGQEMCQDRCTLGRMRCDL
jgi:hypothetical protein